MFGRLKDWRRGVTRYDRNPVISLSAIALAASSIPHSQWKSRLGNKRFACSLG
jgi:hypothetical protein